MRLCDMVWYLIYTVQIAIEVVRESGEKAKPSVAREELGFLWRHLGAHHALVAHLAPDRHGSGVLADVVADVQLIAVALALHVAPHRVWERERCVALLMLGRG